MVQGPDGNPYVIDRSTKAVYRVNLKNKTATLVAKSGTKTKAGTVATPRFLGVGGLDLLILDSKNVLWRWRPADDTGKGTLTKPTLQGAASLGDDILGINTFLRPGTRGLYNLYVIDPSEQQIRAYSPAADGGGFPAKPTPWLATARDVSKMTSTFVDGDIYVTDGGSLVKYTGGKDGGWAAKDPKDLLLRPAPAYSIVAAGPARAQGAIYAFDLPNARVIAVAKVDGAYQAQYRLAGGARDWSDLRAMYIVPGSADGPATLVWMSSTGVNQAILVAVPDNGPQASPGPSSRARAPAAPPRRPRNPPRSPDRALPVIPLRDANPTRRTPFVTLAIVIACVVAFAWELGLMVSGGQGALDDLLARWGVIPADLGAAWGRGEYVSRETATLVTSQFLHGGWLHLGGNMLYLWIFGNNVEDRFGRVRFLVFYLVGGRAGRPLAGRHRSDLARPDDRGVRGDRGDTGRLPRALPAGPRHDARLPRLLLPAHRRAGDRRPGLLVRAPAHRRPDLARGRPDRGRSRLLRAHRRVRRRGRPGQGGDQPRFPAGAVDAVGRGIIRPWTTGWSRWSSRASGSTCSPAATW